jgi:hypothetical protein
MGKISQCDKIVEYMREHGGITQLEAYLDIGCWRLASRISDLKKRGYGIRKEWVTVKNRYGESVPVARYSLKEGETVADNRVQSCRG